MQAKSQHKRQGRQRRARHATYLQPIVLKNYSDSSVVLKYIVTLRHSCEATMCRFNKEVTWIRTSSNLKIPPQVTNTNTHGNNCVARPRRRAEALVLHCRRRADEVKAVLLCLGGIACACDAIFRSPFDLRTVAVPTQSRQSPLTDKHILQTTQRRLTIQTQA